MTSISIKNMVCTHCVMMVRDLLTQCGLHPVEVSLGCAIVEEDLDAARLKEVGSRLNAIGFEMLDDPKAQLVEKIRTGVIQWVHDDDRQKKLSEYLCDRTHKEYSALSKLFSEIRGVTIERYCVGQRIEYAKELISYNELSISEVAYKLGYSSPAQLSNQFKQVTGMTPKEFRANHHNKRISIDEI